MDYTAYLSRSARALRASGIRRSGDIAAHSAGLISLAPGFPEPEVFAWDDFRDIAARVLTGDDGSVLQYGPTRGYDPLLDAIPHILAGRDIHAGSDEVIITTGSQQGLDLCARVFIDPGDVVLLELPAYTGAITAFGNAQARLVGVRQDESGPDLTELAAVCARELGNGRRIAFLYVVPNFQNPTGVLTTLERRQQLLDWATEHDLLIVEDDPYGALYFDDVATADETRPIKARDADGRVIYLSSFSKTVAPGLRVAWITAPATIIAKLEIAKQSADLCTSSLDQRIIFEMLRCGALERRLPILRDCYKRKRTVMERAIRREFRDRLSWIEPKGGFFVWTLFPPGVDTDALLPRAIAHGVVYVPGSAFFVERQDPRTARLAFSGSSSEQIERGIARLADALQEEMRARGVSDGRRATA